MKPYLASLINAIILILLGLWGYFGSEDPSFTALIPVVVGVLLLVLNPSMKRENRIVAHIVVALTFLLFIALFKPLTAAIGRSDTAAIIRVLVMIVSTLVAMVIFVRSFLDARRNK